MKINKGKVKERLAGIPESKRSHIYDASLVLDFLVATFLPTKFFLPEKFNPEPGLPLGEKSMRKISEKYNMSIGDLYEMYLLFREEKDYTSPIESRYIFGIIIKNLRYYKNRWELTAWRVGTAQIWFIGPLKMRKDATHEERIRFTTKVEDQRIDAITVKADPVTVPEEDTRLYSPDEQAARILNAGARSNYTNKPERFTEARWFVEAKGD